MMPRPMKPIFAISSSPASVKSRVQASSLGEIGRSHESPAFVVVWGLYSQPIQPCVAELVDAAEHERIVDLAGSWLVAAGIVGDLDVADAIEVALDRVHEIALHDLRMVDVVLQLEILCSDRGEDGEPDARTIDEESGDIVTVDRLQEKADLRGLQLRGGILQVLDKHAAGLLHRDIARQDSSETIDFGQLSA